MILTAVRNILLAGATTLSGCEVIGATTGHVSYDVDVVDAVTRQPIPTAHIFVRNEAVDDPTDGAGHFSFGTKAESGERSWYFGDRCMWMEHTIANGRVLIRVDKPGYLPAEIEAGYNRTVSTNDVDQLPYDPHVYRQIALRPAPATQPTTEKAP